MQQQEQTERVRDVYKYISRQGLNLESGNFEAA